MSTTCNTIVQRAAACNTLNQGLTSNSAEMLSRILADQQRIFTAIASGPRDRFTTTASLTSTPGSSGRTFDLSAITSPPIERILTLTLADGQTVRPVDALDTESEFAPRYVVRGQTLVEVSNDWGSSGAKSATLLYVHGATAIDPNGSLSQLVSVPDAFVDVLVFPLAGYLAQRDPGRDAGEIERLALMLDEANDLFSQYLTNYGGVVASRFVLPNPLRNAAARG